jgi:hypothetical protein
MWLPGAPNDAQNMDVRCRDRVRRDGASSPCGVNGDRVFVTNVQTHPEA